MYWDVLGPIHLSRKVTSGIPQAQLLFLCAQLCNFFVFVHHCVTSMVLGMQNLCIESCMCRPQKAQTHEPTTNLDRHEIYIEQR